MGRQRNGKKPTKADLASLERMLTFGVPSDLEKRHQVNEAHCEFRTAWNAMRQEVLDQYEANVEAQRQAANPPPSDEQLQRMGLLSNVYLPSWQRAPGNLVADAISFEQQGDEAGLRLARQHIRVLDASQRSKAAKAVDEALSDFRTDEQRQAGTQARSLALEHDRFEMGTSLRRRGMISAISKRLEPPPAE